MCLFTILGGGRPTQSATKTTKWSVFLYSQQWGAIALRIRCHGWTGLSFGRRNSHITASEVKLLRKPHYGDRKTQFRELGRTRIFGGRNRGWNKLAPQQEANVAFLTCSISSAYFADLQLAPSVCSKNGPMFSAVQVAKTIQQWCIFCGQESWLKLIGNLQNLKSWDERRQNSLWSNICINPFRALTGNYEGRPRLSFYLIDTMSIRGNEHSQQRIIVTTNFTHGSWRL